MNYLIPLSLLKSSAWRRAGVRNEACVVYQGWEAQPYAHLNANFKSINICSTIHDYTSKFVCCISKHEYLSMTLKFSLFTLD